jgi:hypothetical protein
MSDRLLSIVSNETGSMVSIHANMQGLDLLLDLLLRMKQNVAMGRCEHDHLFAAEELGAELTLSHTASHPDEKTNAKHLKIYGWTDEWARKNGLLT